MTNHHENRSLRRIRPLRSLLTACAAALLALSATAQERDYVQYVNTLQGTDSHFGLSYGNTFATTAMPYAMHTWSAQTGPNGEGWKYQYFVDRIRGFQQARTADKLHGHRTNERNQQTQTRQPHQKTTLVAGKQHIVQRHCIVAARKNRKLLAENTE